MRGKEMQDSSGCVMGALWLALAASVAGCPFGDPAPDGGGGDGGMAVDARGPDAAPPSEAAVPEAGAGADAGPVADAAIDGDPSDADPGDAAVDSSHDADAADGTSADAATTDAGDVAPDADAGDSTTVPDSAEGSDAATDGAVEDATLDGAGEEAAVEDAGLTCDDLTCPKGEECAIREGEPRCVCVGGLRGCPSGMECDAAYGGCVGEWGDTCDWTQCPADAWCTHWYSYDRWENEDIPLPVCSIAYHSYEVTRECGDVTCAEGETCCDWGCERCVPLDGLCDLWGC